LAHFIKAFTSFLVSFSISSSSRTVGSLSGFSPISVTGATASAFGPAKAGAVEAVRGELREMITEDFDILMDSATPMDLSFQETQTHTLSNCFATLTFTVLS
jgi:hypothetical protein